MQLLSHQQRNDALLRMSEQGVDVLVVGGGITGAGVALDAAARGYRVGLVEKADFSSGTSSKSTKLIHGGIRYLSQLDLSLIRESLVERGLLFRNAPHLVQPIGFLLPVYSGAKKPMGIPFRPPFGVGLGLMFQGGLFAYDLMSGSLGIKGHRRVSKRTASRLFPCLNTEGLVDAFIYYDGQTDDSRLTATVIRTAALHGALVANHVELTGFRQEGGAITAAIVEDRIGGSTLTIPARIVVNAGGVFAGRIEEMAGASTIRIKPAKGVHLTVPRRALKMGKHALVLPETDDGRLLFLIPWGSRVTIGTTDTEGGDIDRPAADDGDVAYLLRHVNNYMRCTLKESDIISAWAGYRPLIVSRKSARATSKLSRTHAVLDGPGGLVTIIGGKLTTYRRMAQDTVDHIGSRFKVQGSKFKVADSLIQNSKFKIQNSEGTERLPLSGAEGWQETRAEVERCARAMGMKPDTLSRLATYGSNSRAILDMVKEEPRLATRIVADLPYIMAEVVYACRYEMALELSDVLERRLRISLEDRFHGTKAAAACAALMAAELGWDVEETRRQVDRYCGRWSVVGGQWSVRRET